MNNKTNVENLKEYEKKRFVFHGSPNGEIEILEPRQSKDSNQKKDFNKDLAVFASTTPVASTLFACMVKSSIPKDKRNDAWSVRSSEANFIIAEIPAGWKSYITKNSGYVFIFTGKIL